MLYWQLSQDGSAKSCSGSCAFEEQGTRRVHAGCQGKHKPVGSSSLIHHCRRKGDGGTAFAARLPASEVRHHDGSFLKRLIQTQCFHLLSLHCRLKAITWLFFCWLIKGQSSRTSLDPTIVHGN